MSPKLVSSLALFLLLSSSEAMRFLVFFPLFSKSHTNLGHGVVRRLLSAGHEVVYATSNTIEEPPVNLTQLRVFKMERLLEFTNRIPEMEEYFKLKNIIKTGNVVDSNIFRQFVMMVFDDVLKSEELAKVLGNPRERFDAVIVEWFFMDAAAGIAALLQSPLIWFSSTEVHWQVMKLMDEIPNPAYNVDLMSTSHPPLSFWERAFELWTIVKKSVLFEFFESVEEKALYEEVFTKLASKRGVPMPPYHEAINNGSFLLVNSHPSFGIASRLPQNVKYIGGYHIKDEVEALPEDLQKLMDESKQGVVYFSMGSNLKSTDMSDEMRDSLLRMFGGLRETVIWKFEADLTEVPKNVKLLKWAPQTSILAHRNLKLFITHGGQLSTTEAIHYGVPVVGLPIMADQHVNMRAVQHKGFGIRIDVTEDSLADDLNNAIKKMLGSSQYKARAEELSRMYHDRQQTPGDELVYWAEYVVRTRGAPHLRSPAFSASLHQRLFLDLSAAVVALCGVLYLLVRACLKSFRNRKAMESRMKKKRQ